MAHSIFRYIFDFYQGNDENELLLLAAARKLIWNGYEPVPILGRDKKPWIPGWQCPDEEHVTFKRFKQQLLNYSNHRSIGLLTRYLPSIDLDLTDEKVNAELQGMIFDIIGATPFRRRGSKGVMLSYRLDGEPRSKMIIKEPKTDERPGRALVEIFNANGQYVAIGRHPCGTDYRWLIPGQNPLMVPRSELPPVKVEDLLLVRDAIVELLTLRGYHPQIAGGRVFEADTRPPSAADIEAARDYTALFLEQVLKQQYTRRASGWYDLLTCPGCGKRDGKSGFCVTPDGGFYYHCHHASCEFNKTTGWSPGGFLGPRTKDLYEALGGDKKDFIHDPYAKYAADIEETEKFFRELRAKRSKNV